MIITKQTKTARDVFFFNRHDKSPDDGLILVETRGLLYLVLHVYDRFLKYI
jgi:hypothetical protein